MPTAITAYKIFIATPGGLEQEREAFRAAIKHYNESDAVPRGVLFIPIGWEITLPSFGRPQELINQDLRQCDYFVLVLWDRWGTPPTTEEGASYTSGTEEELTVAQRCLQDDASPMRQIAVFFKAVEPRQLSDPGEQLQKVLAFRLIEVFVNGA